MPWLIGAALTAIAVAWVDRPLARAIAAVLPPRSVQPNVPDVLAPFVAAVTLASLGFFFIARRRGSPRLAAAALCTALAGPLAYGLKELLKWFFGRITVSWYLIHPQAGGFHWLHGQGFFFGFPSGHMLVATALVTAVASFYPRMWPWGQAALAALAIALLLTSYHFLGDLVAGYLLGRLLAHLLIAAVARSGAVRVP
ncbi:MAG TPA: phosphatase PAP2 family protein [Gammaproteobacteria bacterium]|nr:phosphatase PAP2 family protein [Gammaproteobacteria bacterium]